MGEQGEQKTGEIRYYCCYGRESEMEGGGSSQGLDLRGGCRRIGVGPHPMGRPDRLRHPTVGSILHRLACTTSVSPVARIRPTESTGDSVIGGGHVAAKVRLLQHF